MAKRQYTNKYPSVTTVLGILRKPALEYWFKINSLEFCTQESARSKIIGKQIHEAIQSYIETGKAKAETEYAEEVTNALKSFMLFRKEMPEISLQWSEMELTSERHQFNGTIDCIGEGIILDWKTATCKDKEKPFIYDEYLTQVSAYVNLYNESKEISINKAIIVSIAKDKIAYNTYLMDSVEIQDNFNEVFLPALRILNYNRRKSCPTATT